MNSKTSYYDVINGAHLIVRCGCLSEAVSECRNRGFLDSEGYKIIHWTWDDKVPYGWAAKVYNVYGEVI